jgi:hypothetical protein
MRAKLHQIVRVRYKTLESDTAFDNDVRFIRITAKGARGAGSSEWNPSVLSYLFWGLSVLFPKVAVSNLFMNPTIQMFMCNLLIYCQVLADNHGNTRVDL